MNTLAIEQQHAGRIEWRNRLTNPTDECGLPLLLGGKRLTAVLVWERIKLRK